MKGRRPIASEVKRALSTDGIHDTGHRKIADDMQPEQGAPTCPRELTGEAKAEWARIVKELAPARVLTKADRQGLIVLCKLWAMMQETSKGNDPKSFKAYSDLSKSWKNIAVEYGLTPLSRPKISAPPAPTKQKSGDCDVL